MKLTITGKTVLYGIIGYPVRHSLSPLMQNIAFQDAGIDAVYVPFEIHPENLKAAVEGLKVIGVQGFNVTIPHKTAIIPFLDVIHESATAAGAVNTVKRVGDEFIGYNTDGAGLLRSLANDCSFDPVGKRVVLYGAGGAARGAVAALCRAKVCSIHIVNRTETTALGLISAIAPNYKDVEISTLSQIDDVKLLFSNTDLLLNTTSLGMKFEKLPGMSLDKLQSSAIVYDMVYSPPRTPLLQEAEELGLVYANGFGMLASQGELAFEIWTGILPARGQMYRSLISHL